jgi:hypothetical protein
VTVSFPSLSVRVEECRDCGRRSHWQVCRSCGEVNGPRRVICLECGLPFEGKPAKVPKSVARRAARSAPAMSP